MESQLLEYHRTDEYGRPAGGQTIGRGFTIAWQDGPLGEIGSSERKEPNGAFVEDVIKAAIGRLTFYQSGQFACDYNARAIDFLQQALRECNARTEDRTKRDVEGTHAQ